MLLNPIGYNHLQLILLLFRLDPVRVDDKLVALHSSTKPELSVEVFLALVEYLHDTVVDFASSKAGSQALLLSLSGHLRVEMTENLGNFTSSIETSKDHSQHRLVPRA